MKINKLLTVAVFLTAIASAFASEYLVPQPGFTAKSDVPIQTADCQQRDECNGTNTLCKIAIDPDGDGPSGVVQIQLYDGTADAPSDDHAVCGDVLMRN